MQRRLNSFGKLETKNGGAAHNVQKWMRYLVLKTQSKEGGAVWVWTLNLKTKMSRRHLEVAILKNKQRGLIFLFEKCGYRDWNKNDVALFSENTKKVEQCGF